MTKPKLWMCNRCGYFFIPDHEGEKFCNHCQKYNKRFDMEARYLHKGDKVNA